MTRRTRARWPRRRRARPRPAADLERHPTPRPTTRTAAPRSAAARRRGAARSWRSPWSSASPIPAIGLANGTVVNQALAEAEAAEDGAAGADRSSCSRPSTPDATDPPTLSDLADAYLAGINRRGLARRPSRSRCSIEARARAGRCLRADHTAPTCGPATAANARAAHDAYVGLGHGRSGRGRVLRRPHRPARRERAGSGAGGVRPIPGAGAGRPARRHDPRPARRGRGRPPPTSRGATGSSMRSSSARSSGPRRSRKCSVMPRRWVGVAARRRRRPARVSEAHCPRRSSSQVTRSTSPSATSRSTRRVTPERDRSSRSASSLIRSRRSVGGGELDEDVVVGQGEVLLGLELALELAHHASACARRKALQAAARVAPSRPYG